MTIIDKFISVNYSSGRGGKQPSRITMHTAVATADSLYSYFNTPTAQASSSFYVNGKGTVERYVRDTDTAWANSNFDSNQRSFSIEHWDNRNPNDAVRTDALYNSSAQLVAYLCKTYSIPCMLVQKADATNWGVKGIDLHNYFNPNKSCPAGLNVQRIINEANNILNQPTMSDPTVKQLMGNLGGSTPSEESAQYETDKWKNTYGSDYSKWMWAFYDKNAAVKAYFVKTWEDQVTSLTSANTELQGLIKEQEATIERQGQTISDLKVEIAELNKACDMKDEQIKTLTQQLSECQAGNQKPSFTINIFGLKILFIRKQ